MRALQNFIRCQRMMTRLYAKLTPICFLICTCPTFSNAIGLTLEEQVQQLGANYGKLRESVESKNAQLEAKVIELEAKVIELEAKVIELETHVQKQDIYKNKIRTVLETTITQLETLVEQKDHEYITLVERIVQLERTQYGRAGENFVVNDGAVTRQSSGRSGIARTCRDAHLADPSLSSGNYWIDPDGQGVGDAPIFVYCNMTSGTTSISHDSEAPMDVGHCLDPGCYYRAVNYNASLRQISALAELSAECHQSIQYECNFAPFEFDGVPYAWWNNKDGGSEYFWAGSNASVHTCQCGIEGNCFDALQTCNCDSAAPIPLEDKGIITRKDLLPITALNFGRTQLSASSGVHTLGPFECTGQTDISRTPSSCQDLWRAGHSLSGLYSVMGTAMVESVYCDFAKLPNDACFQKWIGFVDVKSSPTYFYVQRETREYYQVDTPIPFDVTNLNTGRAMNLQSGIFTAPRTGIYFFTFTGVVSFPGTSSDESFVCILYKNNDFSNDIAAYINNSGTENEYQMFSLQATLPLQTGDQIWVEIYSMSPGVFLYGYRTTHFSGWLLEENISL